MPKQLDFSATENCVCFNLRWVARVVTQFFDAELRRHGIRPSQGSILLALKARESWSMAELSDFLGMERTTLVRNLQPLQRDGLVKAAGGGRGNLVELAITAKGRKQVEKFMPAWESAQSTAVQVLGEKRWSKIKKSSPNMKRRTFLKLAALSITGLAHAQSTTKPSNHNKEPITMNDVIIIGGSFAGLAGALQLGRARRKVTVLDTGLQRNRFAGHSHGLLGHDHKPPLDILAEARRQLARYPTIKLVNARADSISGAIDDFSVRTADGESLKARRLILSYGVVDQMPDVPGFAEGWGKAIVPCPYCDGFEFASQHWGLIWSGPQSHNQVRLFQDWTDRLTVFAAGHEIPPDIRADLVRRKIPVVDGRIIEIAHRGGHSSTIKLDTGSNVAVDILFAHPRNKPSASLHESLGLATANTPLGVILKVDERRQTSVPGIYAAGDLANPVTPPSVTLATAHGATAGIAAQQSMLV